MTKLHELPSVWMFHIGSAPQIWSCLYEINLLAFTEWKLSGVCWWKKCFFFLFLQLSKRSLSGPIHPAFTYKLNVAFELCKHFFKRAAGFTEAPADILSVQAHDWQEGGLKTQTVASSHTNSHRSHQSLRSAQISVKNDHLTWSSTLWATIVAPSSCSASLRGLILKATCNTQTGFRYPYISSAHRRFIFSAITENSVSMGNDDDDSTQLSPL